MKQRPVTAGLHLVTAASLFKGDVFSVLLQILCVGCIMNNSMGDPNVTSCELGINKHNSFAGVGHDLDNPAPSSHSAHSSLLQHVLLLEQARQQTAMLAGTPKSMLAQTIILLYPRVLTDFSTLSPHVQPVSASYGGERRVRRNADRQQAASP